MGGTPGRQRTNSCSAEIRTVAKVSDRARLQLAFYLADRGERFFGSPDTQTEFFTLSISYRGASTGFMVKVPFPVQFVVAPVTVHVPVICPPLTVPCKVRVFTCSPVKVMT